jgi:hypothetical protein
MARGATNELPVGPIRRSRPLVRVALRDFDGDVADQPARFVEPGEETWLTGLPQVSLGLTDADRLAIARWAYPPDDWLTPGLCAGLFAPESELSPA